MRKSYYKPSGSQESFIVPLLAIEVECLLKKISASLSICKETQNPLFALDCGCGNQPFRETIIRQGFGYKSLDVAQNSYGNVDYICNLDSPVDDFISIASDKFSLVLVTEVLEHVSDWYAAFQNIYSCTAPGGYVLLTAPFFYPLHEEPNDYLRPTIHQFVKVSRASGFEVLSIKKVGNSVHVIGTALAASKIRFVKRSNLLVKILNKVLVGIQSVVFVFFLKYQDYLTSDSDSIYLSNVVLLRRN